MNIETIFPYRSKLFIGSETGMYIYDISQMPEKPQRLSVIRHIRMRDPIVVEGYYAYVTLRSNRRPGTLQVYNIRNLSKPRLISRVMMNRPHGLAVDDGRLFICENKGVMVLDAAAIIKNSFKSNRRLGRDFRKYLKVYLRLQMPATDVILHKSIMLIIGEGGLYQYDYSDLNNIRRLSHIIAAPAGTR